MGEKIMKCSNCDGPVSEKNGYYIKSDGTKICWDCAMKDEECPKELWK